MNFKKHNLLSSSFQKISYYAISVIIIVIFSALFLFTHRHFRNQQISNFIQSQKLFLNIFENSFQQLLDERIHNYQMLSTRLAELYSHLSKPIDTEYLNRVITDVIGETGEQVNWVAFYHENEELLRRIPDDIPSARTVLSQQISDYLDDHEIFIRNVIYEKNTVPSIDIILKNPTGEEKYYLVVNFSIQEFIQKYSPSLESFKEISFLFINEDGTIFSILNVEHELVDIMEKGNIFEMDTKCVGCHKPTYFDDIRDAFEQNMNSHLEYINPVGNHFFRNTEIYQFYNNKWAISVCYPFFFVRGMIEKNARQYLTLFFSILLIVGTGGYVLHRNSLKNAILEETRSQTAHLNKLFENDIIGIVETDNDGIVRKTNDKFLILFERKSQEVIGRNIQTVLDLENREGEGQFDTKSKPDGGETIFENGYFLNSGRRIDVVEIEIPVIINGNPAANYILFQDITDKKKSEEQRLWAMSAIRNSKDAINITDLNDNILFANAGFEKMYQYSQDEVMGKNIFDIVRIPEDRPPDMDEVTKITRADGGWQGERLNVRRDGTVFPIYLSTAPIRNSNGVIIGSVGLSTDISKQKMAEQKLKESEKMHRTLAGKLTESNKLKNLLLDIITHDLKNPIGTANGFSDLLTSSHPEIEEL